MPTMYFFRTINIVNITNIMYIYVYKSNNYKNGASNHNYFIM